MFHQVDIYAGSLFLYEAVGWNIYISAAATLAITAIYTVLGIKTSLILLFVTFDSNVLCLKNDFQKQSQCDTVSISSKHKLDAVVRHGEDCVA